MFKLTLAVCLSAIAAVPAAAPAPPNKLFIK
jgi:hypothetical protein